MDEKRLQEIEASGVYGPGTVVRELIAEVRRLRAMPTEGPGSHKADLAELRAVSAQAAAMRAVLENLTRDDVLPPYMKARALAALSSDAGRDFVPRSERDEGEQRALASIEDLARDLTQCQRDLAKARAEGAAAERERCAEIAKAHRRDTEILASNPGQSRAAFEIENEIRSPK